MNVRFVKQVMALAFLTAAGACATTGGLKQAPLAEGTSRNFSDSYETVLKATREAVSDAGLHVDQAQQVDSATWMIVAKKDASAWSMGELVRVVIQQQGPNTTAVRVISAKRMKTNVFAKGDYSDAILGDVALKLSSTGAGK
jgi:hypothetical protein